MKKLYVVTIETEMMVIAKNEQEAGEVAGENLREHLSGYDQVSNALEVTEKNQRAIPTGWLKAIPFGNLDDECMKDEVEGFLLDQATCLDWLRYQRWRAREMAEAATQMELEL